MLVAMNWDICQLRMSQSQRGVSHAAQHATSTPETSDPRQPEKQNKTKWIPVCGNHVSSNKKSKPVLPGAEKEVFWF